jgi:hypothetical protein
MGYFKEKSKGSKTIRIMGFGCFPFFHYYRYNILVYSLLMHLTLYNVSVCVT